jgi:hypothetical protein
MNPTYVKYIEDREDESHLLRRLAEHGMIREELHHRSVKQLECIREALVIGKHNTATLRHSGRQE